MDKAQLQTWNDIQNDGWYDVFQKQIDKADADYQKNNDLRLSLLTDNFNMEKVYPQLNLTGKYSIYRDNKDKKIYIKANQELILAYRQSDIRSMENTAIRFGTDAGIKLDAERKKDKEEKERTDYIRSSLNPLYNMDKKKQCNMLLRWV